MDLEDFHLSIESTSQAGVYRVRVLRAFDAAQPFEERPFPYAGEALAGLRASLRGAVSGRDARPALAAEAPPPEVVREFGRALFGFVFDGRVRDAYVLSKTEMEKSGGGLRLRLWVQPPELAALPWEALYDGLRGNFYCRMVTTPMVRTTGALRAARPRGPGRTLRVVLMCASPASLPALDLEAEKARLKRALDAVGDAATLEVVDGGGRDALRAALEEPCDVFHFAGHGSGGDGGRPGLLFDEGGAADLVTGEALAELLARARPRLVVLNTCHGAEEDPSGALPSVAGELLQGEWIAAVVAMQSAVSDPAALGFASRFYERLARGDTVDVATAEARTAMGEGHEWVSPVVYVDDPDTRLFSLRRPRSPEPPAPRADHATPPLTPRATAAHAPACLPEMQYCLAVVGGPGSDAALEQCVVVTDLVREVTIGRSPRNDLPLDDDAVSREHARVYARDGAWRLQDLGSQNGTRVNGEPASDVALQERDEIKVGRSTLVWLLGRSFGARALQAAVAHPLLDQLTRTSDHRAVVGRLRTEITRVLRSGRPDRSFALLLVDIDGFGRINEAYGRGAGDEVLRHIARVAMAEAEGARSVARVGGGQFWVLLAPGTAESAALYVGRLRAALAVDPPAPDGRPVAVTFSCGVAPWHPAHETPERLMAAAREALAAAKRDGAAQTRHSEVPGEAPAPPSRTPTRPHLSRERSRGANDDPLPYPLAVLNAHLDAVPSAAERLDHLVHALGVSLRLVVALELALTRAAGQPEGLRAAARLLGAQHRTLLLHEWAEAAWRLAAALPASAAHPAAAACRALAGDAGGIAGEVAALIAARDRGAAAGPSALAREEARARRVLDALLAALRPLADCRLVSVEASEFTDEGVQYRLRVHQGPREFFPLRDEERPERLVKEWCYLLADGQAPLLLSPMVCALPCALCNRVEVFVADRVVLGPEGAATKVFGVLTGHEAEVRVAWRDGASALYAARARAGAT